MSFNSCTEGEEYSIRVYAIEIEHGKIYSGVSLVCRLPGGELVFSYASADYGYVFEDRCNAVRYALVKGQGFVRSEQRRSRCML